MDNETAKAWDQIEKYALECDGQLVRSKDTFWFEMFGGAMRLRFEARAYTAIVRQELVPRFFAKIAAEDGHPVWRVEDRVGAAGFDYWTRLPAAAWDATGSAAGVINSLLSRVGAVPTKQKSVELSRSGVGEALFQMLAEQSMFSPIPLGSRQSLTRSVSAPVFGDLLFALEAITSRPSWSTINEWEL